LLSAFEDDQELYPKDSWKQKTILLHLKKLNNHTQKMAGNKSHTFTALNSSQFAFEQRYEIIQLTTKSFRKPRWWKPGNPLTRAIKKPKE
jgi:hypothetical protein